jgi:hypothetical protein
MLNNGSGGFALLLRLSFAHGAPARPPPVEPRRQRAGGGQGVRGEAVRLERFPGGRRREARRRQWRAKRGGVRGVRCGTRAQRRGRLRLLLLPALTPATGGVGP